MESKFLISTVADDAVALASKYGLGIEIADFCTAYNMDEHYQDVAPSVKNALNAAKNFVFHAPFNELYPSAIDPKAVEFAHARLNQALNIANSYGIQRIVVHSGNVPQLYFKSWFEERSIIFWREFLFDKPDNIQILMENVLEDDPELLPRIVRAINDPRMSLCLDIGHANCMSEIPVTEWLKTAAKDISHFHIHNNSGKYDEHNSLDDGKIDMQQFLCMAVDTCPNATFTVETIHAEPSVLWLCKHGWIGD